MPEHMAAASSSTQLLKVWQVWPGTHSFLCDGRLMLGADAPQFALTNAMTLLPVAVFAARVAPQLEHALKAAPYLLTPGLARWGPLAAVAGLCAATLAAGWVAALADPGIIPRAPRPSNAAASSAAALDDPEVRTGPALSLSLGDEA